MERKSVEKTAKAATGRDRRGGRIVYWMQQDQRLEMNLALNEAIREANERQTSLDVVFILTDQVPEANLRHYQFMLEGLAETGQNLIRKEMGFTVLAGDPRALLPRLLIPGTSLHTDLGYLRWQRKWRSELSFRLEGTDLKTWESSVIVPVEIASVKEEYAAATLRGKLLKRLEEYLVPLDRIDCQVPTQAPLELPADVPALSFQPGMGLKNLLDFAREHLNLDESVAPSTRFQGGHDEASRRLDLFLERQLRLYADKRNDPSLAIQSDLSPYLHFGQISALEVALRALEWCEVPAYAAAGLIRDKSQLDPLQAGLASFLEELIVRRELSCNFCHYNPDYDSYACVPLWARQSLNDHLHDPRPYLYSPEELETARTHDPFWNAAQTEMLKTGKMHNYLRMYWGKKIIEWTPDPESAYSLMLWLNNKYQLDGRDPNSFAGVAWCFGKHDRPWQSRSVFGSVRYMNAAGLQRKFNMQGYLDRVREM